MISYSGGVTEVVRTFSPPQKVVAKCAFYNKTLGASTNLSAKTIPNWDRSQALLFDKCAAACGKNGAAIAYFIAAPAVAASSGVVL
jgi:hypothetical protein